jgi:putative endonuclease
MSRDLGRIGEAEAESYLMGRGFKLVENNYFARVGEIDIIATKDNIWHFIEVKSRCNEGFGEAVDNITKSKINKIIKSARRYMFEKDLTDVDWQLDAVLIDPEKNTVELIENIYCEGLS